jgi:hypothetical protein
MSVTKPFRVSYYAPSEVVDGRAPLHSIVVYASNGQDAKGIVGEISDRKAVKSYPFYRNLNTPKRRTWHIVSGPQSDATKAVLADLSGFAAHDKHEQMMDTFQPKVKPPAKFSRFDVAGAMAQDMKDAEPFVQGVAAAQAARNAARICRWHGDKIHGRRVLHQD